MFKIGSYNSVNNGPSPAPEGTFGTFMTNSTTNGSFTSNFENLCPENTHSFIGQESEHQQERHLKIQQDSQVSCLRIFNL